MMEAAKQFIGKDCYIYMLSGECRGIIREVTDHALIVEMKKTRELINLDFVLRIRELPGKNNG